MPGNVVRVGSILWLCLQDGEAPRAWSAVDPASAERYGAVHASLLAQGVWMAPSAYEVAFVSTAHGEEHVDRAVAALERALAVEEASPETKRQASGVR